MSHLFRAVFLLYAAGCWPSSSSSSSPDPSWVLVIQKGQNASLSCNLSSSRDMTWYLLRSEQLLPLLTLRPSKLSGGDTADVHSGNTRLGWAGAVNSGQVSLEITEVQEEDAGMYFCAGRHEASEHVNRGIQLTVSGVDGKKPIRNKGQPCWTLGVWVLTALVFLCFVLLFGFCLRSGKPACCCDFLKWNDRLPKTKEESLHYSSLKHVGERRHTNREEPVTYSTVSHNNSVNRSQNHCQF